MAVELDLSQDRITAYLSGEIDHHIAAGLRREIDGPVMADPPPLLVLDFGGVTFMDSSGIAVLLRLWQRMEELAGTIQVTGLPDQPARVLRAAGLQRLIPLT